MIVMGCVHGEMAREAGERGELLPYDIYKDIHDAIRVVLSLQQRRRGILIGGSDLREFYKAALPAPSGIAPLFPSPSPAPTYNGDVLSPTFTRRLSRSGEIFVLADDETTRQSEI